jgi:hypothetical protein
MKLTYYYSTDSTKAWNIADEDIRFEEPRFVIAAKNGMILPNTAATKVDFALFGLASGFAQLASISQLSVDSQLKQYVIDTTNFVAFQKNLRDVVKTLVAGSGKDAPPTSLTLTLKASVQLDANTRVPVTGDLPVQIYFIAK